MIILDDKNQIDAQDVVLGPDEGEKSLVDDAMQTDDELSGMSVHTEFLRLIPISYAREHGVLLLIRDEQAYLILASNNDQLFDIFTRLFKCRLEIKFASKKSIQDQINKIYQAKNSNAQAFVQDLTADEISEEVTKLAQSNDLLDDDKQAPVIKLVNLILLEAVKLKVSDIHIQPTEHYLAIRMRIDGQLTDIFELPKNLQDEILSRVKILARMNIAEKRLPQDGRASVYLGEKQVDLRVSSIPASFGERIVIRLLDKSAKLYSLDEIGMLPRIQAAFSQYIHQEHGIVLVTGPTGSGKSTTMYAALQKINAKSKNILTLEDPIEYQLEGISQTQINEKKGMTFEKGLRSVLRQDPDVIMVGEIRDVETAVMGIQSALTGHLVFSSLHTNDAASAVTRLLDLGIEPFLVSSSVIAVLAQRLIRKLCVHCAERYTLNEEEIRILNIKRDIDVSMVKRAKGCDVCRNTGYQGRVGLFELMPIGSQIQSHIISRSPAAVIKTAAINDGMTTLGADAISRLLAGQTSFEEVHRILIKEEY